MKSGIRGMKAGSPRIDLREHQTFAESSLTIARAVDADK
jgi:hypothetical protein